MGTISCLDALAGDIRIQFDKRKTGEVDMAKKFFRSKLDEGYVAFKLNKRGDKGEQIREFDPEAERMILARPLVGG